LRRRSDLHEQGASRGQAWTALITAIRFVRDLLSGRLPVLPRERLSFVDVRDMAAMHAAVLRPGRGARYLLGGPAVEVAQVAAVLGELTGRRLPQRTAWTGCCGRAAA
jgi:uncharacterized protein YbjT (DUF2867 family)